MERLDATSRSKIQAAYRENALYMVVSHLSLPYTRSLRRLRLLPEEVFQQVVAWLDRISREADNDEVMAFISNAWDEQCQDFLLCMGADIDEREANQATGLVMIFLFTCLAKLRGRLHHEGRFGQAGFYGKLAASLHVQMEGQMTGYGQMMSGILDDPYYRMHNPEVGEWIAEYMLRQATAFTDQEGRLKTSVTQAGRQKGRKTAQLFIRPGGEKDEQKSQYWARLFLQYLASRNRLSKASINTSKANFVLLSIRAFKQYWEDKLGLQLSPEAPAYVSFLTEDCALPLGQTKDHKPIQPSSVSDKLSRMLKEKLSTYEELGHLKKVELFMESLREKQ